MAQALAYRLKGMGARHLPANRTGLSGGYRPGHWDPRCDQAHYICGGREKNTPLLRCVNLMFTPNGLKRWAATEAVVSAKGTARVPATSACLCRHLLWASWPTCVRIRMNSGSEPLETISFFSSGTDFCSAHGSCPPVYQYRTAHLLPGQHLYCFTDVTDLRDGAIPPAL